MIDEKPAYDTSLKTSFPILTIRKMLRDKDFKKLNITLSDYHKAYEQDVRNEDALLDAFIAFSVNDENHQPYRK